MATFLIERNIPGASQLTPEQLRAIAGGGPGCRRPRPGMITDVSLRLLYLIFNRLLDSLTLLGRASTPRTSNCLSCATKSPYSAEPTRGRAWTGPTGPCSPR